MHKCEGKGTYHILTGSAGTLHPLLPTHGSCRSLQSTVRREIIYLNADVGCFFQSSSPRRSIPIKAMVRCLPLWAIFMGFFSHFWLCTIILTYLPTYISTVLHVNIRDVSTLLSCDPDNSDCGAMLSVIFQ